MAAPPPPSRPRGARPMPNPNGSNMNLNSPETVDSAGATTPYLNARPRLALNVGGGLQAHMPPPQHQQSQGSESFSLRPDLSLVYGQSATATAKKPALKLGLQIDTSRMQSGNNSLSEPHESYDNITPQPNANGTNTVRQNEMSDLWKAIEAIQIREATDPKDEDTIRWNNNMFEKVRRLGEGMGGAVYQVKQKHTGKMMAMKTIPENRDTPPRQVRRELEFLLECIHPNIAECYGIYLSSENAVTAEVVLLMEFCEGGSLETVLKKHREQKKRIGEQAVAKLAKGILLGLDYLHGRKIVHRDIKPSNILLTKDGVVKLCDIGISVYFRVGAFTPPNWYLAPERLRGDPYSIRSDVWSTGLTILELAQNKFPYPPDLDIIELINMIVNGDIPELEDEAEGPDGQPGAVWSQSMKNFVKRCLIIDSARRPTPREILQDPWIVNNGNVDLDMEKWIERSVIEG